MRSPRPLRDAGRRERAFGNDRPTEFGVRSLRVLDCDLDASGRQLALHPQVTSRFDQDPRQARRQGGVDGSVDRPAFDDPAEVQADSLRQPESLAVQLYLTGPAGGANRLECVARSGEDLVEVPIVSGGDHRSEQCGIEATGGPQPGRQGDRHHLRERGRHLGPRTSGGVHSRELAVASEPREPTLLPLEDRPDVAGGPTERGAWGRDAAHVGAHRPKGGTRCGHHEPPVELAAGAELTLPEPDVDPPTTYRTGEETAGRVITMRRVIFRITRSGRSVACAVSCGGLGTAPKTAAGARKASAPATHAQARSSRLEARGRRTLSVIEDLGLVALAARTVIAFELGFRLSARQGCNAA